MITIQRKLAVINGYIELPNGYIMHKTSLTPNEVIALVPGSEKVETVNQQFIQLPSYQRGNGYPEDWFKTLIDNV